MSALEGSFNVFWEEDVGKEGSKNSFYSNSLLSFSNRKSTSHNKQSRNDYNANVSDRSVTFKDRNRSNDVLSHKINSSSSLGSLDSFKTLPSLITLDVRSIRKSDTKSENEHLVNRDDKQKSINNKMDSEIIMERAAATSVINKDLKSKQNDKTGDSLPDAHTYHHYHHFDPISQLDFSHPSRVSSCNSIKDSIDSHAKRDDHASNQIPSPLFSKDKSSNRDNLEPSFKGSTTHSQSSLDGIDCNQLKTTLRSIRNESHKVDNLIYRSDNIRNERELHNNIADNHVKQVSQTNFSSIRIPHTVKRNDENIREDSALTLSQLSTEPNSVSKESDLSQNEFNLFDSGSRSSITEHIQRQNHSIKPRLKVKATKKPSSFDEYLEKYYGIIERRDYIMESDEESEKRPAKELDSSPTYLSDALEDDRELKCGNKWTNLPSKLTTVSSPKSVRFEDLLDDAAPSHMDGMRLQLSLEERKSREKAKKLGGMYQYELKDYKDEVNDILADMRKKATETELVFKSKLKNQAPSTKSKPSSKYTGFRSTKVRNRSTSASPLTSVRKKGQSPYMKKSRSSSSVKSKGGEAAKALSHQNNFKDPDGDLLPSLLKEFPYLYLSTETIHKMWQKSAKQMENLTNVKHNADVKKSKADKQIEEAEYRQKILVDIMKKELSQSQRMKEIQERQKAQQSVKASIRDKRIQSARSRRYFEDYHKGHHSKMLKKKTREELIFKKLFDEALKIQKQRIDDLRKYSKENREIRNKRQEDELATLETFYRNNFAMLAESMNVERNKIEMRENAQKKALQSMKTEMRKKMEDEIQNFQEQLTRNDDDDYWRQLDADRLLQELAISRYKISN